LGDGLRIAVAALALASTVFLPACQNSSGAEALARMSEAAQRDLYCSWAMDAAARHPFRTEKDVARMTAAQVVLAKAAVSQMNAEGISAEEARAASSMLKERTARDHLQYTLEYSVDVCIARADELAAHK
jgi:hypothetical protein